jgi:hypothetical protein
VKGRVSVAVGAEMSGWVVDGVVLVPAAVGFGQANRSLQKSRTPKRKYASLEAPIVG